MIEAKQSRKRKGKAGNNTQDAEAAYHVKLAAAGKRKTTYGFKLYANTDEDGFVKKMTDTPGNVHDAQAMDKRLDRSDTKACGEVYADSAYANQNNDAKLGKQNNKILHRAYSNKPLTDQQKQDNKQRSSVRYIVERTFGLLKQYHGLAKAKIPWLRQAIKQAHNALQWVIILKLVWIFLNKCRPCGIVASDKEAGL